VTGARLTVDRLSAEAVLRAVDAALEAEQDARTGQAAYAIGQAREVARRAVEGLVAGTMYCPRCRLLVRVGEACRCGRVAGLPLPPGSSTTEG
jgi:hypothetical protein